MLSQPVLFLLLLLIIGILGKNQSLVVAIAVLVPISIGDIGFKHI